MLVIVAGVIIGFLLGVRITRRESRRSRIENVILAILGTGSAGGLVAVGVSVFIPTYERLVDVAPLVSMQTIDPSSKSFSLILGNSSEASGADGVPHYFYWTKNQNGGPIPLYVAKSVARVVEEDSLPVSFVQKFVREPVDLNARWYSIPVQAKIFEFHIPKGGLLIT